MTRNQIAGIVIALIVAVGLTYFLVSGLGSEEKASTSSEDAVTAIEEDPLQAPEPSPEPADASTPEGAPGGEGEELASSEEPDVEALQQRSRWIQEEDTPPTLENSDAFLRERLATEESSPLMQRALQEDHLLRRSAAATDLVARAGNPFRQLTFLVPRGDFEVVKDGTITVISDDNYKRYDELVTTFDKLPEQDLIALIEFLEPAMQTAYNELGNQDMTWKDALGKVVQAIEDTPTLQRAPEVVGREHVYIFRDPRLEELPPVSKALIRMGPMHTDRIKRKVARIWRGLNK